MKKYAFSTAALYPLDSAESLKMIGDAGFKYAELMPQCFSDVSDDFASRALDTGVRVSSIHYPLAMFAMLYTSHPGMSRDGCEFGRRLVRMAEKLGTEVIVIHPHIPGDPKNKERLEQPVIDNIKYLADICLDKGITLGMENSPKGPARTATEMLAYIASFDGHPAIKPVVDTTEACEAFQDPGEFIKTVKPAHLHLSDHKGEVKHLPAGEGELDWNYIKSTLDGYTGYYTLEPSYRFYLEDTKDKLKKSYQFISELFGDQ